MKSMTWIVMSLLLLGCVAECAFAAPDAALISLPKDTLVKLRFTDPVSTRAALEGQKVNLRAAEDVYVGTTLVIKKDETTTAVINKVKRPGSWGRSGKIEIEFGTIKAVDGADVKLGPWTRDDKAPTGYAAGASVGGAVLLGPVGLVGGLFVKGKHVDIPIGQEIDAAVRWDTAVKIAAVPPKKVEAVVTEPPAPMKTDEPTVKPEAKKTQPGPGTPEVKESPKAQAKETVKPASAKPEQGKGSPAKPAPKTAPKDESVKDKKPAPVAPVIPVIEDVTDKK